MSRAAAAKCCRSTPRCADCPVLLARRRKDDSATQRLVAEVLWGAPPVELPPVVSEQLELLATSRRRIAARGAEHILQPAE